MLLEGNSAATATFSVAASASSVVAVVEAVVVVGWFILQMQFLDNHVLYESRLKISQMNQLYLTAALSGVRMASLDASHETTVPSGTLVSRRTLKWMGVGNYFASRSLSPVRAFLRSSAADIRRRVALSQL